MASAKPSLLESTFSAASRDLSPNLVRCQFAAAEIVTDGAYKVGSYDSFSGSKTIALKINSCVTKGAGKMSITKDAFPKIGAAQNLPLTYFAKVSGDAPNSKDVQAANVVFTISIVG